MADIEYRIGRLDRGLGDKRFETFAEAFEVLRDRLRNNTTKKWQIYRPAQRDWGRERDMHELRVRLKEIFDEAETGHRRIIRGSRRSEPKYILKKVEELIEEFNEIVRIAARQLGDEYTWGAAGPDEFDCSGLVVYCVGHATGIWLPHQADAIRRDDRIWKFEDRSRVQPGDIVFCHVGRLPAGVADHCGIAKDRNTIIDASSSADKVVQRNIDANPIMQFGRLEL